MNTKINETNEKNYWKESKEEWDELQEKMDKLLVVKKEDLDVALSVWTDKEKNTAINWGLLKISELEIKDKLGSISKDEIFKWVHAKYNELLKERAK